MSPIPNKDLKDLEIIPLRLSENIKSTHMDMVAILCRKREKNIPAVHKISMEVNRFLIWELLKIRLLFMFKCHFFGTIHANLLLST